MSDNEYVDVDIRIPEDTAKDLDAIAHLMKVPVESLIQDVLFNHLDKLICMRTFEQFCEPRTKEIGAPVADVSPKITEWANEYGQSIRRTFTGKIDALEAELENMAKELDQAHMATAHFEGLFVSQKQNIKEGETK